MSSGSYIWPLVVILAVSFLIWTEDRSQNCYDKPCQHSVGVGNEDDTEVQLIDKVMSGIYLNHLVVDWRRCLLLGLILAIIIFLVLSPDIAPLGGEYFSVVLVIALICHIFYVNFLWRWFVGQDEEMMDVLLKIHTDVTNLPEELHQ